MLSDFSFVSGTNVFLSDFKLLKLRAHDLKSSVAIMGLLTLLEEKLDILELTTEENSASQLVLEEVKDVLLKSFF